MSSTGGGIVVKTAKVNGEQTVITPQQGQQIIDALTECGHTALAEQLQPVVNDAT
jgi:hypothetical protein